MSQEPLRTPCHDWHVAHGGRMVDFAGWHMPVQYTSIVSEHQAVRQAVGLFDIAHMGRLLITGPEAEAFINSLTTNDVRNLAPGQIQYSLVTRDDGGILDDILVYRLAQAWLLVVNASNREKIVAWLEQHRGSFQVTVTDQTTAWSMLALQGPRALDVLQPLLPSTDLAGMKYYTLLEIERNGQAAIVSRTGYTGEDGFEVILPAEQGLAFWESVFQQGQSAGILPCGLGCRDTLRLEAAMPLYGHELNENLDPFTAGLNFAIKLDKGEFRGRATVAAQKDNPNRQRRVGLFLDSKRIAREGSEVFSTSGDKIGVVTSGTFSPTLERSLAMAYVAPSFATPGCELQVDLRGTRIPATVTKLPFYKRSMK